ncbi:uncharacterized protein Dwil_GK12928 [Drosophila willistoni]|uniref:CHK kinase-like domain-containing protein n=1 Tax=Drosophila willistoni TaxID=7260 RepID=B4NIM1_DROWI|nr:uncharacterized protein LOC6651723 [Drosophila willistoni]EDW84844.1 uncharacterized protein Dwil_GK12928 [Drosophila willistoni]
MSVTDLISALDSLPKFESEVIVKGSNCPGVPDWLTETYLEHALQKFYNDQALKITALDLRPALGKGENFGGVLTRLKVDFRRGDGSCATGHYILKTSFEGDEFARKAMEPYDIFNREMSIYEEILPKLKSLLLEIHDEEEIFAQTMTVDYDRSALVFEDLNARGFVMPDRLLGLDLKLARLVLRKLAKMHATSAVLNERENGALESYDRGMFNRHTENYAPCFLGLLAAAKRRVSQWPGYEKYAEKLESLLPIYMELGKRVFDVTQSHINVLAHGDLWTNNVLVKYDKASGEPLDVIIIDFQYSAWGSPAIDLFYFLNSSLQWDLHLHHQEDLIRYYFDIFSATLRKLRFNGNIPSLVRFRHQIQTKEFYAMHTSCTIFPIHRNVETEDADFNALMENNQRALNFKDACLSNPVTQRLLKELLAVYDRKGLLDANQ